MIGKMLDKLFPKKDFVKEPIKTRKSFTRHLLKHEGKPFICDCGCHYFKKLYKDKELYQCPHCESVYESVYDEKYSLITNIQSPIA